MRTLSSFLSRNTRWLISGLFFLASIHASVSSVLSAPSVNVIHHFAPYPQGGGQQAAVIQGSDGNFYGASYEGGAFGVGAAYQITPAGVVTILHSFNGCDGSAPVCSLVQAADGNLYGSTQSGGSSGYGTVFRVTPGGVFTLIHEFTGLQGDGNRPESPLVSGSDGNLYGTTYWGGSLGRGTFYRVTLAGVFTQLHSFGTNSEGTIPTGPFVQASDGTFYGITLADSAGHNSSGVYRITPAGIATTISGSDFNQPASEGVMLGNDGNLYGYAGSGSGAIYKMTLSGTLTWLYTFPGNTGLPLGHMVQASDGNFYGTTAWGGDVGGGSVFRLTPAGTLTTVHSFHYATDGDACTTGLDVGADGNLYGLTSYQGPNGAGTLFRMALDGTFTVVHGFGPVSDGSQPYGGLVQGSDGYLYGTTSGGGATQGGSVYRMDALGNTSILHSFTAFTADGLSPNPNLAFGNDGNLYGTTLNGGSSQQGVVFSITPGGVETVLYTFTGGADGGAPKAGLKLAADGSLYGTNTHGGSLSGGVVFRITTGGVFSTIASLPPGPQPQAPLTQGADGTFYGIAISSTAGQSTIFHIASDNSVQTLYTFPTAQPAGGLLLHTDGNYYGVSSNGAFKMTPSGTVTYFSNFTVWDQIPASGLVLGADGNFYGVFFYSLYSITPSGTLTSLYKFNGICDGNFPKGDLLLASDGNFYGATLFGPGGDAGGVFQLTLSPQAQVLTTIAVSPNSASVAATGTQQFAAIAKDQNGAPMSTQPTFTWLVSGGGTIDASGLFTAGSAAGGPFTVTATSGPVSGTASVTVTFTPVLTSISVNPSPASVAATGTQQFTAIAKDQNGAPMSTQPTFTWLVSGGGTIDASGLFTAGSDAGGPFTVTATSGPVSGTASVTVTFTPVLTSISVSPSSTAVITGLARQFTATGKDQNGAPMSTPSAFTWSVSGGGSVNSSGLFTAGGVAGGPFTVTATSGPISGTASVTVTALSNADFNGDGKSDLVLQDSVSNKVAFWYLNGPALITGGYISATPPAGWPVVGEGDFNGDGKPDLVMQSSATHQVAVWALNGSVVTGGTYISSTPTAEWNVVGVGDFDRDGKADLILQNSTSNKVAIWYLNGTTLISGAYVSVTPAATWRVVGAGDINGDGKMDLVLQDATTRKIAAWYLNGVTVLSGAYLSATPPVNWKAVGVADYNGDGKPDVVLQNQSTNQVALWYMNGVTLTTGQYVSSTPSAGWQVVGPH